MDLYEKVAKLDILDNDFLNELIEYSNYNSRGTLNMVVKLLTTIKERLIRGDKIKLENGKNLTLDSFEDLLDEKFTVYITDRKSVV